MLRTSVLVALLISSALAGAPYGAIDNGDRGGFDLPGSPFTASGSPECSAQCWSNLNCKSWAFDTCGSGSCWLKGGAPQFIPNVPCRQSGVITASRGTIQGRYGSYQQGDVWGGDMPGGQFSTPFVTDCQSRCANTPGCTFWAFDPCGDRCWLKSGDVPSVFPNFCRIWGALNNTAPAPPPPPTRTFRNPIMKLADPWVLGKDGWWYITGTTGCQLAIWRSRDFSNFWQAEWHGLFDAGTQGLQDCWAAEMHVVDGWLYFYFSAAQVGVFASNKLYVLKADSQDPFGSWSWVGRLHPDDDHWAIDQTIWSVNGNNYALWSGHEEEATGYLQHIFIAQLGDPTRIVGPRVKLHSPLPWQMSPADGTGQILGVNEGPEILEHNGRAFLIYSSSGCWTTDYSLSMMWFNGGDPLDLGSWTAKDDGPVMRQGNGVYGPGHNTFATDNSGTTYVIYHANDDPGLRCGPERTTRAEPLGWDGSGNPIFPNPPANFGNDVRAPVL